MSVPRTQDRIWHDVGLPAETVDLRSDVRRAVEEPANYTFAPDVTLHLVPNSRHCHNFASHRRQLWDRIARWVPTVAPVGEFIDA